MPAERFHCDRSAPYFSYVTTLRVKIAFSPVKQTPIPARAGTYRFTGQFCSKRWRLSFAKLGQPPTRPRTPAFIEGPARPGYTKKFRRNHLYCRYLAGRRSFAYGSSPPRYGLLLPGQARRGSQVRPKELLHMPGSSLRPRRAVQTFGLTRPSMLLPPSQRRRRMAPSVQCSPKDLPVSGRSMGKNECFG